MTLNTTFEIGQFVRSLVNAQGLKKGATYEVIEVSCRSTFVGTFTTYRLDSGKLVGGKSERFTVGNGHLVLELV